MSDKFFKLDSIVRYIIIFIPLLLTTGPLLPDLFLSIIVIFFLTFGIKNNFFSSKFFFFYLIFYLLLILSSLNSNFVFFSIKSSILYVRFILFSFAICYFFEKDIKDIKNFFIILFLFFLVIIIDGFFQYFNGENLLGFKLFQQNEYLRVTSFFNKDLKLGSYLARFFPLFFYGYVLLSEKKKYFFLLSPIFSIYLILIFLTGERTAIFLFTLAVIFLIIFIRGSKFKLLLSTSMILGLLTITVIFNFDTNLKKRIVDQTKSQIYEQSNQITFFSKAHESHFLTSLNIFKDKPFFGSGPNTFRYECKKIKYSYSNSDACSTHPHNTYIQLLGETGIFSFIFVSFLLFYFLSNSLLSLFKKNFFFKNNLMVCCVACILINLWPFSPSGNFFNNWINVIYYIPFGFYLLSLTNKNTL